MAEGDIVSKFKDRFPGVSEDAPAGCLMLPAEDIQDGCLFLKQDLGFDYLMCLSSVDYKDRFALVYHLYSFKSGDKLCLKVILGRDNPAIKSITNIWPAADWQEREAYDMMGINFIGHPDLRRILLPDDWLGYPLRKDYQREGFVPMPQV